MVNWHTFFHSSESVRNVVTGVTDLQTKIIINFTIMHFDKTYCDKVKCNMCNTYQWVEVDETEHCLACGETGYLMDVEPENENNRYQYLKPQIIE